MKFVRNTCNNSANIILTVICIYDNFKHDCLFKLFMLKSLNFWYSNDHVLFMQTSFFKRVLYFDVTLQVCR